MLSLCMIVKNEEDTLKRCLSNVIGFVDDIVVVDTGSKDNTKAIAEEFTDKVYDFTWCDDFSAARNFSISKAANDWIFVLDSDEFVVAFSKADIYKFIASSTNVDIVGRIKLINVIGDAFDRKRNIEMKNRVFNRKYFEYSGKIHEQITPKCVCDYKTIYLEIEVEHIGYTKEVINKTDKLNRNIKMLDTEVSLKPEDPYLYYQLGKAYYMLEDYVNAVFYFDKALSFDLNFNLEYAADLVETYGYALINSGKCEEALKLEKFTRFYENNPDFNFIMGLIYMNNAMFEKAVKGFLKCTQFTHGKVEGVTSFSAYYNIGVIYDVLGIKDSATKYYKMCGNYKPALSRLKSQLN